MVPCTVTVTRSCCPFTRLTNSDRCDFTSATGRLDITKAAQLDNESIAEFAPDARRRQRSDVILRTVITDRLVKRQVADSAQLTGEHRHSA